MSAVTQTGAAPHYFVPAPSRHPASLAVGMLLLIFGASQWINGVDWGGLGDAGRPDRLGLRDFSSGFARPCRKAKAASTTSVSTSPFAGA